MADLGREEEELTGARGSSGGSPLFSDTIRLMRRPLSEQRRRTAAAAELGFWGVERRNTMEREE